MSLRHCFFIVILDINKVINLAQNNILFLRDLFVLFQMINYFDKKV